MRDEIFDGVKDLVEDIFARDGRSCDKAITGSMPLREEVGLDSIDLVVLQVEIEDRWGVRFDPIKDDFGEIFYSINTLCEFLELRTGENDGK